jgi:GNAT superfamily N-acetyltransferase
MQNASLRPAEVRDAAAISHVHVQSWLTTYKGLVPDEFLASLNEAERAPEWERWLNRDISALVAEIGGEIVGFAAGGAIREPLAPYDAELYTIYLLERAQGRGIGKALLTSLAESLVRKGHRSLMVWVLEQNPAVSFYARTGAQYLKSKQVEIGGIRLPEVALGWLDAESLIASTCDTASD